MAERKRLPVSDLSPDIVQKITGTSYSLEMVFMEKPADKQPPQLSFVVLK